MKDEDFIRTVRVLRIHYNVVITKIFTPSSGRKIMGSLSDVQQQQITNIYVAKLPTNFLTTAGTQKSLQEAKFAIAKLVFLNLEYGINDNLSSDINNETVTEVLELIKQLNVSDRRLLKDFIIKLYDNIKFIGGALAVMDANRVLVEKAFLLINIAKACFNHKGKIPIDHLLLIQDCCDYVRKAPLECRTLVEADHSSSFFAYFYLSYYHAAVEYLRRLKDENLNIDFVQLAYEAEVWAIIFVNSELIKNSMYQCLDIKRDELSSIALNNLSKLSESKNKYGSLREIEEEQSKLSESKNKHGSLREIEEEQVPAGCCNRRLLWLRNTIRENHDALVPYVRVVMLFSIGALVANIAYRITGLKVNEVPFSDTSKSNRNTM